MQDYNNTYRTELQEQFFERRDAVFRSKKVSNEYLALAYQKIDSAKSERLSQCCTQLVYKHYIETDQMKLHTMNSCRVRLCPLCTWRRSLRTYADNKKMFQYLDPQGDKYGYVLLTLTVKNVRSSELCKSIDELMYAFKLFSKSAGFKKAVKGWYRGFEVTHNTDFLSSSYDTYHPHFHVLLVVNKSYFTDRTYLSKEKWTIMWKDALKVDYDPVVDVRRVKNLHGTKAVAEISKYAVKDSDYIVYDDWELTTETVATLDKALANRRLIAYGGILREAKKALKIDDSENADLVHIDDENSTPDGDFVLRYFFWHTGYRQYIEGENG